MSDIIRFIQQYQFAGIVIFVAIVIYLITGYFKNKLKRGMLSRYESGEGFSSDDYIKYYRQVQYIDLYRLLLFFGTIMAISRHYERSIFGAFAIATGAIILSFQTFMVSLVVYFYIVSHYKIGETVRVGQLAQGEIISIKPLHLGIAGRSDTGDHTGEYYQIPNNKVWENPIIKIDIKTNSYKKIMMSVYFEGKNFDIGFNEFYQQLVGFLDELLPVRKITQVSHYKSYSGVKYKIDYEYDGHGAIKITIGFISRLRASYERKRKIIDFVESLKSPKKGIENI